MRNVLRDPQLRLGLIAVLAVVGTVVIGLGQFVPMLLESGGEVIEAEFESTGQLQKGDEVRIDGVPVGRVREITVNRGGRSALVRMTIRDEGLPIYDDAAAAVRWRLVLGGSLVVDLDPGTPGSGELTRGQIPIERTSNQVELDEVTTALGGDAEHGLRQILKEVPKALADPAAPEAALREVADTGPTIGRAAGALRGQEDGDLRRLIRASARTVQALDEPTEPVKALVEGAARTLETTGRRGAELRRTLDLASPAMDETVATLDRLEPTLTLADPLLARLEPAAADLAPTAEVLRPFLAGTDRLLDDARPLLRSLRPAVSELAETGQVGVPLLQGLMPTLRRADNRILPGLAEVDPVTQRSTYEMIGPNFAVYTGSTSGFDEESNYWNFGVGIHLDLVNTEPCRMLFDDPAQIALCDAFLGLYEGARNPSGDGSQP